MAKKLYSDQFKTQYSNLNSIIYNAPGGKKLAIKPAFYKQKIHNPLANHLSNKVVISSIPSIYCKKVSDADYTGFNSKQGQILFIRKVYFGLLLQLVLVVSLQCISKFVPEFKLNFEKSSYFNWISLSSTLLTLIILACCEFHRRHPYNYIAICYFTCSAAVFLMHFSLKAEMIFYTIMIFTTSIIGLTIFTCQTKFKYTIYTGLCTVLTCDIIAFISLFVSDKDKWSTYLYSEILACAFLLFIVIDIQIMVSGNHKYEIRDTEYVFATMTLYTDIVNLFIYVLQLLNSAKD